MRVELTYFKLGGKFYTSDSYDTNANNLEDVWDEVRYFLRDGRLPGLIEGEQEFIVLINAPEHKGNHPRLVVPGGEHQALPIPTTGLTHREIAKPDRVSARAIARTGGREHERYDLSRRR